MPTKHRSSFTRQVYGFAVGFGLLCIILMLLTWLQGPRIRSVTFNTALASSTPNQQLLLHLNQPIGSLRPQQVKVTPQTEIAVTSSGNTVAIQFAQPLLSNTTYHVELTTEDRHNLRHTFRTDPAVFYYAESTDDHTEIRKTSTGSDRAQTVFSGSKVEDYLVLDSLLVLAKQNGTATDLVLYDTEKMKEEKIELPGNGTISQLHAAPGKRNFGFLYSDYTNNIIGTIMLYDLNARQLQTVGFSRHAPVQASSWQPARNGKTILAQTLDFSTLLINPGTTPVPLGQFGEPFGFSHDDTTLFIRHLQAGGVSLNLKTMEQTPLVKDTPGAYITNALPLATAKGSLVQVQLSVGGKFQQKLLITRGAAQEALYAPAVNWLMNDIGIAANNQFVSVEEQNRDGSHQSHIISASSGTTAKTVEGSMIRWPGGL